MVRETQSPVGRFVAAWSALSRRFFPAYKFPRSFSAILLILLLLGEAGVAAYVMRDLARSYATVESMYNGSVQVLLRFGDVQYEAQETRRSTLYALSTNDANLQVDYADQSRSADRRVTEGIAHYLAQVRTSRQAEAGRRLAADWSAYLTVRDDVLGLILEGSPKEAVQLDLSRGIPEFDQVRHDLDEIKILYDQQASRELTTVAELSRRSTDRLTLAVACGLLFGMLAIWAIQRSRMQAAVQLAKLQMDFVASISHELRTPITAILTAGENIRDGLVLGREQLLEQGSVITEQGSRLVELVDQVLLFSATSQSALSHPLREFRVEELIAHSLRSTKSLLESAKFTIEQDLEPGLPPIFGDLSLLSQCLENLIVNAVKYGSDNRWIRISARLRQQRRDVLIHVEDRGIGIKPSELPHIFDPFYRSPKVVAARIRGTGLGLSIAKRSAEIFGGEISVSSEVGLGSTFTLRLPVAKERIREAVVSSSNRTRIDTI
jgi:signal transduction histidine kinase